MKRTPLKRKKPWIRKQSKSLSVATGKTRTMKRTSGKNKKKSSRNWKAALQQEYGLRITYWRYRGLKGVYWHLVSQVVRRRDFERWGTCVSCGRRFSHWRESQAGHYAPADNCGFNLLFDLDNIHAECPSCNNPRFSPGKLIPYRGTLVRRYGEEYARSLDERYEARHRTQTKEWSQKEYDERIRTILDKYTLRDII